MSASNITAALGGKWHGAYGTCCCPVHHDINPSLTIRDGERNILLKCHAGCDPGDIISVLRQRGIWPGRKSTDTISPRRQTTSNAGFALDIWRQCQAASGTLVETYLRGRGITISPPASLRYHPGLKHSSTGLLLPCMVAAVQSVDGAVTGIQRIFLRTDGSDKANVSNPKMMLGDIAGGAVRFARSAPKLCIAEGIETAIAVMQESGIPTWAALSTSLMKRIILPPEVEHVVICADHDQAGIDAAHGAARRMQDEGRTVRIALPSEPGRDFCDELEGATT